MNASLVDLADQLVTVRNLLLAAFMAAQDLDEPEKRAGLSTLLQLVTDQLREAEAALAQLSRGGYQLTS